MTEEAQFIARARSDATVFDITGELDIFNAPDLRAAMQEAASMNAGALIVSLAAVTYFDSQTLEILVDFSKRLELSRRKMLLIAPPKSPSRRLLDVSGISSVIPTFAGVDDALGSLASTGG